jgi:hypothetical protein
MDILAVTIITTASIEHVLRAEKEYYWFESSLLYPDNSYRELASKLLDSPSLCGIRPAAKNAATEGRPNLDITPFKKFVYLLNGVTLKKVSARSESIKDTWARFPVVPMWSPDMLQGPHMQKVAEEDKLLN